MDILKYETAVKPRLHVLILKMKVNLRMKVNTAGHKVGIYLLLARLQLSQILFLCQKTDVHNVEHKT